VSVDLRNWKEVSEESIEHAQERTKKQKWRHYLLLQSKANKEVLKTYNPGDVFGLTNIESN
jgi:hypothetical protein